MVADSFRQRGNIPISSDGGPQQDYSLFSFFIDGQGNGLIIIVSFWIRGTV
jgi:hypothetical protein